MNPRPRGRRAWAEATAAATLLPLCGLMLLPTAAGAAATGAITGTVTAPMGTQIVVTICAVASRGEETCATTEATNINGASPGAYTLSGLAGGEYRIRFASRCSVEPCPETFPAEYYANQVPLAKATPVNLGDGEILAGIDANIEGADERAVREYLENQGPAQPTGSRTGTMPGAIEPLPVNKTLEEEFWAHPPWDRSTISASSTRTGGVAVAARAAIVRGPGAEIPLHCTGAGACDGTLALVEKVAEKKFVKRGGKRVLLKQVRNILIGTAGFSLAAKASETLSVHLTRIGEALIRTAGKKTLKVKLTGSGVKSGALVLK